MAELFFKDIATKKSVGYSHLFDDIVNAKSFSKYCISTDYYTVFYHIVLSLVLGEEIILLDDDMSQGEIIKLLADEEIHWVSEKEIDLSNRFVDFNHFIDVLRKPSDNWRLTLFTSGTTGVPKRITHQFESIVRRVKNNPNRLNDVWGFAYNPTHMAGIQVFFQALLNQNTIIRLFQLTKEEIYQEIQQNKITHISATPTFYRLVTPYHHICNSVLSITSGGERFDLQIRERLKAVFPLARFVNVYASTEAGSIFASDGDVFEIKSELTEMVCVKENELYIHKNLIGHIQETNLIIDDWYPTGDLVEFIDDTMMKFRIIGRKNEMINVGGYKVNPLEVEQEIRKIDNILDVRVFPKKNSILGNIVSAEVVIHGASIDEQKIRLALKGKLQEFKIPRIIKVVEKISTTRTGKTIR